MDSFCYAHRVEYNLLKIVKAVYEKVYLKCENGIQMFARFQISFNTFPTDGSYIRECSSETNCSVLILPVD